MAASSFFDTKITENSVKSEDFELVVYVDGKPRDVFMLNNSANIVPVIGEEFEVKFLNNRGKDVLVQLFVDGVNVLGDGWDAIVKASSDYTFKGFSKDENRIAAFAFAPLDKEAGPITPNSTTTPDPSIGLISCIIYDCECTGLISSSYSSVTQPNVIKDNQSISKNKKKANVITTTGTILKDYSGVTKYNYVKKGTIGIMDIRYNAIGAPIPTAEMDIDFVDTVDYE